MSFARARLLRGAAVLASLPMFRLIPGSDRRHFKVFGRDLRRRRALADIVVSWQ